VSQTLGIDIKLELSQDWIKLMKEAEVADQGVKNDAGKARLGLVFKTLLDATSEARAEGLGKYGPDAWQRVEDWRWEDALLRHMFAHIEGEVFDKQSGLPHLSHVACNLMFLVENQRKGRRDVLDAIVPAPSKTQPVEVTIECPVCHARDMYPVNNRNFCTNGCGTIIKS
jgi:hypothetical protein